MASRERLFLQTDPVGYQDDLNLYAYVRNDPSNATDTSGRECVTTKETKRFCARLERSGREDELIDPIRSPITRTQRQDLLERMEFDEEGSQRMPLVEGARAVVAGARSGADDDTQAAYGSSIARGNEADAYRHANWTARLVDAVGQEGAKTIGDTHERGPGNPEGEQMQDLINNHNTRILREVFPNMSPADLARWAVMADALQTSAVEFRTSVGDR